MSTKQETGKTLLFVVIGVVVLLLAANVGSYFYLNSKITTLSHEKTLLTSNVEILTTEKGKLQADLIASQDETKAVKTDYDKFKGTLKTYFSSQKALVADSNAAGATYLEYKNLDSNEYTPNKVIVDRYAYQINTLKDHLEEYIHFLNNNSQVFKELDVDYKKEVTDTEKGIPLLDDALFNLQAEVETFRFSGLIVDSVMPGNPRTYTVGSVDYDVEFTHIDIENRKVRVTVNDIEIDLEEGESYKFPDGAEIGLFSVLYVSGSPNARFYLGKGSY